MKSRKIKNIISAALLFVSHASFATFADNSPLPLPSAAQFPRSISSMLHMTTAPITCPGLTSVQSISIDSVNFKFGGYYANHDGTVRLGDYVWMFNMGKFDGENENVVLVAARAAMSTLTGPVLPKSMPRHDGSGQKWEICLYKSGKITGMLSTPAS